MVANSALWHSGFLLMSQLLPGRDWTVILFFFSRIVVKEAEDRGRMREMLWIYATLFLVSQVWGSETGTNQSTPVNSTTSSPIYVVRNETFNLDSEVNLMCSNRTWNETMYVIWKIKSGGRNCMIAFDRNGKSTDNCRDGRSLRNTSSAQPYLHIPNFSDKYVGYYKCESAYTGGTENYVNNVGIKVHPKISATWGTQRGKVVAVCKAERGKPAANITWSHKGKVNETQFELDGFFTVESRLELLNGTDIRNVTCVIRHPYWSEEQTLEPKPEKAAGAVWIIIFCVAAVVMFLAGVALFAQKKLVLRPWQQSNTSPSKPTPKEDAEEVEPYASYVQRVNSIYNSSADLFA